MRNLLCMALALAVNYSLVTAAAPVFVTTADSLADTLLEDVQYTDMVEATDADSLDVVTYSLLDGPDGFTVDSASGAIAWTPDNDDVGDHAVEITAADTAGAVDTLSVTFTVANVNDAPVLDTSAPAVDDLFALNGDSISLSVTVSDVDADANITYSWLADEVEVGTGSSVKVTGTDAAVAVEVVVTDGTDTLTAEWTATFVAAFGDSVVPMLEGAEYYVNGTADMTDDMIYVGFSQDIDDASLPVLAADLFEIAGEGMLVNATLSTGDDANDEVIAISLAAGDTMPAQMDDLLILKDGVISSAALVPAAADTVDLEVLLVENLTQGAAYATIGEAMEDVAANDTVQLVGGTYYETFTIGQKILLTGADGTMPLIKWDGDSVIAISGWAGGEVMVYLQAGGTTVRGIEFDGLSDGGDTVKNIAYAPNTFIFEDCVLHDARSYLLRSNNVGSQVTNCEMYNAANAMDRVRGGIVTGCEIHDCGSATQNYGGDNAVYTNNIIYDCGLAIYERAVRNSIFRNNIIIFNDVVYNQYGSATFDPVVESKFIHNTIAYNGRDGLAVKMEFRPTIKGNILYGNGTEDTTTYMDLAVAAGFEGSFDGLVLDNLIGTASPEVATQLASAGVSGNLIGFDPVFVDMDNGDFHLAMNSPAIDAARSGNNVEMGFNDADMGAYGGEYAIDTNRPEAPEQFRVTANADSTDSLVWDALDDVVMYAIYRELAADEDNHFIAGAGNLVDTVTGTSLVTANSGSKWVYKINAVDSLARAGGFSADINAAGPEVQLHVNELNFGTLPVGAADTLLISIKNVGQGDLTVSDLTIADGSQFALAGTVGEMAVEEHQSLLLYIAYAPDSFGTHQDTLFITSDDVDSADQVLAVLLNGKTPTPAVIVVDPTAPDFDTVWVTQTSARMYVNVWNHGAADLVVDTMYFGGTDFEITNSITYPHAVLSNQNWRLNSYFTPSVKGDIFDTLTIVSNDPANPVMLVPFTGEGWDTTSSVFDVFAPADGGRAFTLQANPVSRTLQAGITIEQPRMVRVVLLNATGSEVAEVSNGFMTAGTHQLRWDGNLQAGTYFLAIEGERAVKKVIVVE